MGKDFFLEHEILNESLWPMFSSMENANCTMIIRITALSKWRQIVVHFCANTFRLCNADYLTYCWQITYKRSSFTDMRVANVQIIHT